MVHRDLKHLVTKTCAISNRVIYVMMRINKRYSLQVVQIYAPTSSAKDEDVEKLYEDVSKARKAEKSNLTVIMGDFNAKVGQKSTTDLNYIGSFGLGRRNERGQMFADFLHSEGLFCMNTFFKKTTPT